MSVTRRFLGTLDNENIYCFTLGNDNGLSADISNFGATVLTINMPCGENTFRDIVLGFNQIQDYSKDDSIYFGGTIGRCAGIIPGAAFELQGRKYNLSTLPGGIHLHGGQRVSTRLCGTTGMTRMTAL